MSQFSRTIQYAGNTNAPRKGSAMAAGYDITSAESISIAPGERAAISTGLSLALPAGWYGKIEGRSGLAFKNGIYCFGGVIDADYRGEISVLLTNTDKEVFHVKKDDRIAQLIIQPHWCGVFDKREELSPTARNASGFGSTGVSGDGKRQATLAEMWQMPDGRSEAQLNQELAGISAWDRRG
jgi:dUTP pyrophosphatase